ncbi:S-locus glycoprotein domain containing protein [Parasponia andersonii]|uniref:S-locus glycoprotein domain containing protein n=1 Tax=Parasponia andersonii TaxID=3476 RepID=A0A2P5B4Q8_PARAD|nr:S-locus glycoprotein domain containing protein [Parasponia andersonii]
MYQMPYQPCDSYGYCGANGICGVSKDPSCDCLEGFSPSSKQEWELLNWAKGCKRKVPLDCKEGEGFLKVVGVKLPDLVDFWFDNNMSLKECREECLKNCSCIGCLTWFGDLIDIKEIHVKGSEQDIYIRLSASEIGQCS